MDPLAHTLVGATLAETGVARGTPLAAPTLMLAANAPDIDAVTMFVSRDLSLGFRRGWTHGVLSLALLPLCLVGLIVVIDRLYARVMERPPRANAGTLTALAYLGVATHPALDWLNTYGVRLLMPFDGRWFYGDALFIIDPWLWLLAAATVILAHSRSTGSRAAWVALGVLSTALVAGFGGVPSGARIGWFVGVAAIAGLRVWGGIPTPIRRRRIAVACLGAAAVYIATMVAGSRIAESQARAWLSELGETPTDVMAGPVPANPFVRDIIVVDAKHYHFLEVHWLQRPSIAPRGQAMERGPHGAVVDAALTSPQVRGLTRWMRFPAFTVEERVDGYQVTLQDVRYSRRRGPSLGAMIVDLDRNLHIREPPRQ